MKTDEKDEAPAVRKKAHVRNGVAQIVMTAVTPVAKSINNASALLPEWTSGLAVRLLQLFFGKSPRPPHLLLLLLAGIGLSGCVVPTVTQGRPSVQGRILNARTRMPVAKARIALRDKRNFTQSDAAGRFRLDGSLTLDICVFPFVFMDGIQFGDFNPNPRLSIRHPEYRPLELTADDHRNNSAEPRIMNATNSLYLRDILLTPAAMRVNHVPDAMVVGQRMLNSLLKYSRSASVTLQRRRCALLIEPDRENGQAP